MKKIIRALFCTKIRASICSFAIIGVALSFALGPYYGFFYCKGDSMLPTIANGEWVIIQKSAKGYRPEIGDIVIINSHKDGTLIKRVLAGPGSHVNIVAGIIYINGKLYRDEFTHTTVEEVTYTAEPREDEYWVIGDNRGETMYDNMPISEISGKVIW